MNSIDTTNNGNTVTPDLVDILAVPDVSSDPAVLAALRQLVQMSGGTPESVAQSPLPTSLQSTELSQLDAETLKLLGIVVSQTAGDLSVTPEQLADILSPPEQKKPTTQPNQTAAPVKADQQGVVTSAVVTEVPEQVEQVYIPAKTVASTEPERAPTTQPDLSTMGDEILQSFAAQSSTTPPATTTAGTAIAQPAHVNQAERIEAFVNQITERILVTDPLSGQNAQVHIKVAEGIFPGTELQLWRGEAGQLNVNFATTSIQTAQVLTEAAQLLAQRLNEKLALPMPAVVTVQSGNGEMPQDGRSRQYQSIYDLLAGEQQSAS